MTSNTSKTQNDDDYSNVLAYVKIDGDLVEDGFLGARKSADVLYGIDELVKYFLTQEDPEIKESEIEIPVRIRKKCWELLVPENIETLLLHGVIAWCAGKYIGSALSEIAKNDFKDVSLKGVFRKAFNSLIYVVKISKHLGTTHKRKFDKVQFSEDQKEIGIPNEEGSLLWVPKEYIDSYVACPDNMLSKVVNVVEEKRNLSIGVFDGSRNLTEEEISYKYKNIFTFVENEEEEFLFPELKDGEYVELDGHITRGNENANTIGFLYMGHILTCYPSKGNVKDYKSVLFTNAIVKGHVDRKSGDSNQMDKKPRIKFNKISQQKRSDKQNELF
jgi:hypothetical protein